MDLRGRRLLAGSGTSAPLLLDLGGLPAEVYVLRLATSSGVGSGAGGEAVSIRTVVYI